MLACGNGYDVSQSSSGYEPVFSVESNYDYVDFVSNDFLTTTLDNGFTALDGDSRTIIVLLKQEEGADNIYAGSGYLSTRPFGHEAKGFTLAIKQK